MATNESAKDSRCVSTCSCGVFMQCIVLSDNPAVYAWVEEISPSTIKYWPGLILANVGANHIMNWVRLKDKNTFCIEMHKHCNILIIVWVYDCALAV